MRSEVKPLEIVEVNFYFPTQAKYLPHPALVISTAELFEEEEMFYAVLLSSKNLLPQYTIAIKPEWLSKPERAKGYFVTHMVSMCSMRDVSKRSNTFLKPQYFDLVKTKIISSIFYNG